MTDRPKGKRQGAKPLRRLLPFLPSLAFGLAGAVWVALVPPSFTRAGSLVDDLFWGVLAAAALLVAGRLMEYLPAFRETSRLNEALLRRIGVTRTEGVLLAAGTAVGEELLFRGALLPLVGLWAQALIFGALHPVSLRAWSYTFFTAVAGLLFGWLALHAGGLVAPITAHFLVNLWAFWSVGGPRRRYRRSSVRPNHDA